ncbi:MULTISPECIES: DUF2589 domain-containing protein [unclassified Duganella]|uniref:DUF2589 domain-containing protein n=1 Tax=unclassified Duganella TaxID=2636909 RepID=UPI0006F571A4|nr:MULTISPECIES: DUF2589 domain-containing protein [unclassified Duganella]KQN65640.1 hypothetical protein ASF04_18645 [Duganella sp. Leaf61]MPQ55780.1 DUF2589 domain-containing protein [Duganella sp. FT27W]
MDSNLLSMAQQFSGLPMDALIGGPLNAAARANSAMALTQTKFMLDTCFNLQPVAATAEVKGVPAVVDAHGVVTTPEVVGKPAMAAYNNYSPIMVVMSLTRGVVTPGSPAVLGPDGKTIVVPATATSLQSLTTQFNLPLLTIVPLNSLAVDTVDINFEMEVNSSFSEEQSDQKSSESKGEGSFEAKVGWGPVSVTIRGSASYDSKDSSTHNTHYQKSNSAKYTVAVHAAQLPLPQGVNTIIEAFTQSISPITLDAPAAPKS